MNPYIEQYKEQFDKAIKHLQEEFSKMRVGIASPAMVEDIKIIAYGTTTPLQQLASINVPDPKTIVIEPWDKSIIKDIEKGIADSSQQFNPINEGDKIRISIPPLMEERRKEMIKIIKDKAEKTRITIRGIRDKIKENIIKAEKNSEITEDDKFLYLKQLDETTSKYNNKIKDIVERKEKTLMNV